MTWEEARRRIELDIVTKDTGDAMPRCARCKLVLEGFRLTDRTDRAERVQGKRMLSNKEMVH